MTISTGQFVDTFQQRHISGTPTIREKATEAAPRFVADVLNFLEREHANPTSEPVGHRVLKDDPDETITYHVGTGHKLSETSPYVELKITRPLPSSTDTDQGQQKVVSVSSYSYFVYKGALVGVQRQYDVNALGGTVEGSPTQTHYADDLERYTVRNFLRKPEV